jgi:hypothetical protein
MSETEAETVKSIVSNPTSMWTLTRLPFFEDRSDSYPMPTGSKGYCPDSAGESMDYELDKIEALFGKNFYCGSVVHFVVLSGIITMPFCSRN